MPPPRFKHAFEHDVFLSYTHTDDRPEGEQQIRWVTTFMTDLRIRLEAVSGHTVDIWRDEEKLGAADRFNDTIAHAVSNSAIMLVILSPAYFTSDYCSLERQKFCEQTHPVTASLGDKSRVVKAAKFYVDLDKYPPDLRDLLEYRFYVEIPGTKRYREFHLSEDPAIRGRYYPRVDDVAQEVAVLLSALESAGVPHPVQDVIYLAETTSDLEPQRDDLRRRLSQLGYDVQPKTELRLLSAQDMREFVVETVAKCRLTIHPVGRYYGFVPEGADGKSVVQMQIEMAQMDARNGDLRRIIWVPEGLITHEQVQKQFLEKLRTQYAGNGFEFLERPFRALVSQVEDKLKTRWPEIRTDENLSGIYLVCDNADRALAKTIRSFLFNQGLQVEWTPLSLGQAALAGNSEHEKLLRRNGTHLVLHGATDDAWIQDRIHELNVHRQREPRLLQAIYLADPHREDKDDILVQNIELFEGYSSSALEEVLKVLLERTSPFVALPQRNRPGVGAAGDQ